jgi:hypothetical protein
VLAWALPEDLQDLLGLGVQSRELSQRLGPFALVNWLGQIHLNGSDALLAGNMSTREQTMSRRFKCLRKATSVPIVTEAFVMYHQTRNKVNGK